jgi:F-type H+-transporting ATPase subunit gamma
MDKVFVYYNKFINIIKQVPSLHQLLPIEPKAGNESLSSIDYIFEPAKSGILDVLLPKLVDIIVWRSLLESNAAEQAARMMAMEKATTNANDLISSLELQYNKARQAAITKEMLEIVGGAEALNAG